MHSPVPPRLLRLIRWPGIHFVTRRALRRAKNSRREFLPRETYDSAESFFVHDLIGNVDTNQDGKPDAFRLAITNCWFAQAVTGVELSIDGKTIDPSRILVDNDFVQIRGDKIRRIRFCAGRPFTLTVEGKKLRRGLHIIGLELHCDLVNMTFPLIPLVMKGDQGNVALVEDPWDRSLEPLFEESRPAKVHFCPHIHYDFEWLRTADDFLWPAVGNLQEAVRILEKHPESTFVIDQTPQLEALAKIDPKSFSALRRLAKEGRIEPTLGGHVEPDTNLPCGEALVRQFVRWQDYCNRTFGRISTCAWLIDSFGMNGQLPQILRKCGATALVFSRRMPLDAETTTDFWWRGIDQTQLQTHHLSHFYFAGYPLDSDPQRAIYRLFRTYRKLAADSNQTDLFCPSGIDHGKPQDLAPGVIRQWNDRFDEVKFEFSTPGKYMASLDSEKFGTYQGELNGELTGVNAARIELKQLNRKAEAALLSCESLTAVNSLYGQPVLNQVLDEPWRNLLESHFHDSITGCNTDEVADHIRNRLSNALSRTQREQARQLNVLADRTDPSQPSFLVYNPTGFSRYEIIEIDLYAQGGRLPYVTDGKRLIPYQVLTMERFADKTDKRARVCIGVQVPALGYRRYLLTPKREEKPLLKRSRVEVEPDRLENGVLQCRFDPKTGAIRFIVEKPEGRLWQMKGAGELSLRRDRGTLYLEIQTGRYIKPKNLRFRVVETGPLRGVLEASGTIGKTSYTTRYTLWAGSRELRIRTEVNYNDPGYALFARIPSDLFGFKLQAEIPFGWIERKTGSDSAQTYLNLKYETNKSLTILNRGIPGYLHRGKEILLSLHRSVDKIHFWEAGHGALGIGKKRFDYALRFTDGGLSEAQPWRHGSAFNHPLLVTPHTSGDGAAKELPEPDAASYATFDHENIALTSFAGDGSGNIILRCFEALGEPTRTRLTLGLHVKKAVLTDMLGRQAQPLEVDVNRIDLEFRAFEIKTILITP